MTLFADLAALLVGLLLASSAADAGLPGAAFPTGAADQFGARLSARSYSVHNSYSAEPHGGPYDDVAGNNYNGGNNNYIGSSDNNVGSSYNVDSSYNNIGSSYNVGSGYNNVGSSYNAGSSYNNVGSSYNAGSSYNNVGSSYNNVGTNYAGAHSVYIRNNGHVADNGYTVDTASSSVRAQSAHAVGPVEHNDYQDKYLGDYSDYDDNARYQYRYQVSDPLTGDVKSKHETRDGDAVTGEYRVLEANGLLRIVSYTADDAHGFVAHVRWVPGEQPHGAAVSHQEVTQQQSH